MPPPHTHTLSICTHTNHKIYWVWSQGFLPSCFLDFANVWPVYKVLLSALCYNESCLLQLRNPFLFKTREIGIIIFMFWKLEKSCLHILGRKWISLQGEFPSKTEITQDSILSCPSPAAAAPRSLSESLRSCSSPTGWLCATTKFTCLKS